MEKEIQKMHALIEGKEFKSSDEMNAYIEDMQKRHNGQIPDTVPGTKLQKAQQIVYDAFESEERKERIRLAEKALGVSELCADAYVILAEEKAETVHEALAYYQKGVRAGEKALGKETFEKEAGHFWGILETRPYMRARHGLGQCLEVIGKKEEALENFLEMIKLNPSDNQGIRELAVQLLMELGRYEEAQSMLDRYKNDILSSSWYNRALLAFIKNGKSPVANGKLRKAVEKNPNVVHLLLQKRDTSGIVHAAFKVGGEEEAEEYASTYYSLWHSIEGAMDWLKQQTEIRVLPKVGRNDPCPCGSGKKYKKCCMQ
jgi:tetratricopeptide (TPR) repeat protein